MLLGLPYSPWTERARFALEARRVPHRFEVYTPLVGEPMLRVRLRRWGGTVTVPILIDESGTIADSIEIARWADGRGEGSPLFPEARASEVLDFVELADRGMEAGRALTLDRMGRDPDALAEMIPRVLRKALGPLAAPIGGLAIRRTQRKYGTQHRPLDHHRRALGRVLDRLRDALGRSPSASSGSATTIFEQLTFADIAMAQVIVSLAPPKHGLRLGRASSRAFSDEELARQYADLVEWRDALYDAHRPRR